MPDRQKLDALTGIRFFAALHVLAFHCWPWRSYSGPGSDLVGSGYIGVSLFFVLSGFIFGYNYFDREIIPARFFRDRFARVYPVYALSLLFALPLFLKVSGAGALPAYAATRLTLTQAWFPNIVLEWNTPAWSLSVEAFFYLLFPLLGIVLERASKVSAAVLLALCAVFAVLPGILYLRLIGNADVDTTGVWINVVKFWPLAHLPEFVAGLCLMRLTRPLTANVANALTLLSLALLAIAIASPLRLPYPILHTGGLLVPFGLLIYAQSSNTGLAAKALSIPFVVLLGEASYSLYILHQPAHEYWMRVGPRLPLPREATEAIFAILIIAASIVVLRKFEYPMRLKLKGMGRRVPAELP